MGWDYEKYRKEQIVELGLDFDKLTEYQIDVILEPNDAPENYACDGEISPTEALRRWQGKLKSSGFTPMDIRILTRKIIG